MNGIQNTPWLLPQSVISNGAVTGNPWSNPTNLLLVDGDVSESNPNQTASDVILGNYNVNLPQNAVVTGIQLQVIGYAGAQTVPEITLTPVAVDNTSGVDQYYPYVTPFTGLTPILESYTLGSPTYLFATSWTVDMINNFKLELLANGDISLDSVLLQVFYYLEETPTSPTPTPGLCVDCSSPIQVQPLTLALPFEADDRYAYLNSFNYPDGTPVQYSDLGSCGGTIFFVFDPNVPKIGNSNFEENAVSATWVTLPNGTVQLDFGTDLLLSRGLQFHTPYGGVEGLRSAHDANSEVVISDSAPYLGTLLRVCQIGQLVSAPIHAQFNGADVVYPATKFNFSGAVTVTPDISDPTKANIYVQGTGTIPPAIVAVASSTSGNVQVTSLTYNLPISGINRGSNIQISTEYLSTIDSVTVGGVAASRKVAATDSINNLREEQWLCVAPPLGNQPIVIILSQAAYISSGSEALVGVDPATPIGATQSATGTTNAPTLSLTTTYDNSTVIDGLGTALTPILYTPGAGQGINWTETANGDTRQGGSSYQPAGLAPDAVTMQYAITQTTPWVYTAVEIKGITATLPPSSGVASVTGFYVDNTDPANPVITVPKNNMTSAANPTTSNDNTQGYSIGSFWFNRFNFTLWVAFTVGTGTATWNQVLQGTGKNNPTATTNPGSSDDNTHGYSVGSMWFNNSTATLYVAQSVGSGTAVWTAVGSSGSGGGAWTKISTVSWTATSVPQNTLTQLAQWTGLTGDTDDQYQIIWEILSGTNTFYASVTFNGDQTNGNYASIAATGISSSAVVFNSSASNSMAMGVTVIKASSSIAGANKFLHSTVSGYNASATSQGQGVNGCSWNGSSQITTIEFNTFQNVGTGQTSSGKATLYKINR